MRAYSQDLRERALALHASGVRPVEIARRLSVSVVWVHRVLRRHRETGVKTALAMGGHRPRKLAGCEALLLGWMSERSDTTLEEYREKLRREGICVGRMTVARTLKRLGVSLKKNRARRRAGQAGRSRAARGMAARPARA